MNRLERAIVLWALGYMAVYLPFVILTIERNPDLDFETIAPFHVLGMVQNFVALILTIRDLYRRPFPCPNDKVTWTLLILCTGGIGGIVYVFRYALKPRPTAVVQ